MERRWSTMRGMMLAVALTLTWAQTICCDEPAASTQLHRHLWEDFEQRHDWQVAPSTTTVRIRRSEENVASGYYSMKVSVRSDATRVFALRRPVRLDLSHMQFISLDVFSNGGEAELVIALETTAGRMRFESLSVRLRKGWNRNVSFALTGRVFNGGVGLTRTELSGRDDVRMFSVVFRRKPDGPTVFHLDNLTFSGGPESPWERRDVRIDSVTPSTTSVGQYERVEFRVRFSGSVTDYFDPDQLNIVACVLSPSGRRFEVPGFLAQLEPQPTGPPEPKWLVRLTPTEVGRYRVTVTVKTATGQATGPAQTVVCTAKATSRGFVRTSRADRRYFEFSNGEFFYPVGQNVCWSRDYEKYFAKMHDAGENFVRVWICPWNCWLERTDSLGRYDLSAAARIDDILILAEKHDLYVQLVLVWHGLLNEDRWGNNPYNVANGGPCKTPADFFTDVRARQLFQRKLRYLVARYSWSPRLLAWELVNEVDLGEHRSWDDIIDWHRRMAGFLLAIDPHRDLVTTSAFNHDMEKRLCALREMSICSPHRYDRDAVAVVREAAVSHRNHGKPVVVSEFGSSATREGQAEVDPGGVLLHAALWSSFHSPASGSVAPWWWDTHVEANNLYAHFAALTRYATDFDRRGRQLHLVTGEVTGPQAERLAVQGLLDSAGGTLWLTHRGILAEPRTAALPAIKAGTTLTVTGLLDGPYEVSCWDTRAGKVLLESVRTCRQGGLKLVLPAFRADLAVKLRYQGETVPQVGGPQPEPTVQKEPATLKQ